MFTTITNYVKERWPGRRVLSAHASAIPTNAILESIAPSIAELSLRPFGFNDFLNLNISPRQMLLHPILPEKSLAMLYALVELEKAGWASPSAWLLQVDVLFSVGPPLNQSVFFMWTEKCHLFRYRKD
jgi:hypothetical protein